MKSRRRASSDSIIRTEDVKTEPVVENCDVFSPAGSSGDLHKAGAGESTVLNRLSRAELMSLSQIPETELKRRLMEAIQHQDPTWGKPCPLSVYHTAWPLHRPGNTARGLAWHQRSYVAAYFIAPLDNSLRYYCLTSTYREVQVVTSIFLTDIVHSEIFLVGLSR